MSAESVSWTRLAVILIPVLAIAAYANTWWVPLLLDDAFAITQNPSIRNLRDLGAVLSPPAQISTAGRPLLNLSFALNYAFSGTEVPAYHAVNLGLHILAGLALFGVARLALSARPDGRGPARGTNALAFAMAVVWTVHPLQTASVTYISQRAEVLMGLCYLLTLYFFARGVAAPRQPIWSWLSVGACAAGMMSKEVMVTAPVVVLLFDRTFLGEGFGACLRRRWRTYAGLAATWGILAALALGSQLEQRGVGFKPELDVFQYWLTQSRVVLAYAALTLWPHPLVFDYGREIVTASGPGLWACVVILLGLLAGIVAGWRRTPALAFAGAAFFILLAPTSSLVPILHQPMAENRTYLALAPVAGLLVAGVHRLRPRQAGLALGALVPALVAVTFARNAQYESAIAIWSDTVRKAPGNVRARTQRAEALRIRGDLAGSRRENEIALRLDPNSDVALNNLGLMLVAEPATLTEGIGYLEAAVRANSRSGPARVNLALALLRVPERRPEAFDHLRAALRLAPEFADAHTGMASALILAGDPAAAVSYCEQALRLKPHDAKAHLNLGLALALAGRHAAALRHCEVAVRLEPTNAEAHLTLGNTLRHFPRRNPEAMAHYRRAVQLRPDYTEAWLNLGVMLKSLPGREDEAVQALTAALRGQPDLELAKQLLAEIRAQHPDAGAAR